MGASTALEDAQSLPECLRLAGKAQANLGTKVHEFIRYVTRPRRKPALSLFIKLIR